MELVLDAVFNVNFDYISSVAYFFHLDEKIEKF
jgi:hypothetical protein